MIHIKQVKDGKDPVKKLSVGPKICCRVFVLGDDSSDDRRGCNGKQEHDR